MWHALVMWLVNCRCPCTQVAAEYTGWVRALAMSGKYLLSCGCNYLKAHDTSHPLPKPASEIANFKVGEEGWDWDHGREWSPEPSCHCPVPS